MTDTQSKADGPPVNVIDVDMDSDLSDPPAPPSRDSSILSPPPTESGKSDKKKISLNDKPKTFKASKTSGSNKKPANGKSKAASSEKADKNNIMRELESPEASTSKVQPPPQPIARIVPESIEEDWQIPYIWAFVDKFELQIKGLFTIDDLERGLRADSPEDVLVETIMVFLNNLQKKGGMKADVDTLTANLSAFITSRLQPGLPATVWDPYEYTPYVQQVQKKKAPALSANGKGKGKARDSAVHSDRQDTDGDEMDGQEDLAAKAAKAATQKAERLARNPLLEKGLWQLSWHEKATILRQLVDWQLVENEAVRGYIDDLYPSKKKRAPTGTAITTEPIGKDSENKRIWLFEPTYRIYTQTNPLHFASEWKLLSANKQEYELALEKYKKSGASIKDKEKAKKQAKGKKAKALALKAEMGAARDRDIALALETRLPELEDFETALVTRRIKFAEAKERARKNQERKEATAARAASLMVMGTRRSLRHAVNYAEPKEDEGFEEEDDEDMITYNAPSRRRRNPLEPQPDTADGTAIGTTTNGTLTPAEHSADDAESANDAEDSDAGTDSYHDDAGDAADGEEEDEEDEKEFEAIADDDASEFAFRKRAAPAEDVAENGNRARKRPRVDSESDEEFEP